MAADRMESIALSVVIPAYNEERRLPTTLAEIRRHLTDKRLAYEIVVADDGSTDATISVVEAAAQQDPRVRLVAGPHRGKGSAVRRGVLAARGPSILFCDADLSMPVDEIARALDHLATCDVVIGSREGHGARRVGEPFYRHLMGRVFNAVVRTFALPDLADTQCGFKCFTASSAQAIFSRQTVDGFGFDVEMLFIARRLGCHVRVLPITWTHQASSRVDPVRDTLGMLGDVLRVRWNSWRGQYELRADRAPSLS